MKFLLKSLILCFLVTQLVACKKTVTTPSASLPPTAASVAGNFTIGSFESTGDQTAVFDGFTFTLNENGTIVATNGRDTFNGTWTFDDSNNTELKINFSDAPLNELNKGWHIAELTNDHLLLTDDGGNENADAGNDHASGQSTLEFERD